MKSQLVDDWQTTMPSRTFQVLAILPIKNRPSDNLSDGLYYSIFPLTAKILAAFAPVLADGAVFADRSILFDFPNKIRSATNRMRAA